MAKEKAPPTLTILNDGEDTFVVADGVTIAKRGRPGTAQAGPSRDLDIVGAGFNEDQSQLWVRYDGVQVH